MKTIEVALGFYLPSVNGFVLLNKRCAKLYSTNCKEIFADEYIDYNPKYIGFRVGAESEVIKVARCIKYAESKLNLPKKLRSNFYASKYEGKDFLVMQVSQFWECAAHLSLLGILLRCGRKFDKYSAKSFRRCVQTNMSFGGCYADIIKFLKYGGCSQVGKDYIYTDFRDSNKKRKHFADKNNKIPAALT